MLLAEIFEHLNYGEFSQINIGSQAEETINPDDYAQVLSYINMGLVELYKRFPLRMKEIDVQLYSNILEYKLIQDYATNSGSAEPIKYLLDTVADPFTGLVLKVERVETDDPDITTDLPLNDANEDTSVFTPYFNILKVPEPTNTNILTVHYRAAPARLLVTGLDPDTVDVPIPYGLLEALLFYIASRATANRTPLEGQETQSLMYMQKFETSVLKAKQLGLVANEEAESSNLKLETNGWA